MDILRDARLDEIIVQIAAMRRELRQSNATPLNIDTCDCLACQASAEPFPKGGCEWSKSEHE